MAKLIFSLLFIAASFCSYAQTGKVILNIQGIQVLKGGEISAGIFKQENFPKVGKQFIGREIKVSTELIQIVFENVPVGHYAMVAFQDIDENKQLKSNFYWLPNRTYWFFERCKNQIWTAVF